MLVHALVKLGQQALAGRREPVHGDDPLTVLRPEAVLPGGFLHFVAVPDLGPVGEPIRPEHDRVIDVDRRLQVRGTAVVAVEGRREEDARVARPVPPEQGL